jgi:uncharacterized protein involved in exopolysaccharide biosynthesis
MTTSSQPVTQLPTDSPWLEGPAEQVSKLSLLDLLLVLARQRYVILGTSLLFGVLALIWGLLQPKMYESAVTVLPPAQMVTRGVGGSLGDLSSALSMASSSPFKSSEDFWISVLKGRTITERVVKSQNLQQVYHVHLLSTAAGLLRKHTSFEADKAGLITIAVRDKDPQRAAQIANAYIDSMHQSMSDMAIDDANQRRAFYNSQVEQERGNVEKAENDLMEVERKTGVIELGGQTAQAIREIADLRARITLLTVQLQSLRTAATDENPEVQRLKSEMAADQEQLTRAESQRINGTLGVIGAQDVPQDTLDYIRATRDLRYHQSLYEALGKQVQAAQMDEARSAPMVQIVDAAVPADHPAGLGRGALVFIALIVGFLVGIGLGLLRQFWHNMAMDPEGKAKLQELAATLQGRA